MRTPTSQAVHDEATIRALLEDVYVRDMYVKRERGALSREFSRGFQMLSPTLDGATGDVRDVRWVGLEELMTNHPKAILRSARFDVPWIDAAGDAAVARVDVFDGDDRIYTDYVSLYRIKGVWRVVCKLFHRHRPRVEGSPPTG